MIEFRRKDAGAQGEDTALAYLEKAGLKLVQRNYRCKAGEIDLVMLDRKVLALIEVRYRSDAAFGGAVASVTSKKQQRLINAAGFLILGRSDLRRYSIRFDVLAIDRSISQANIEWIKDAFRSAAG
jgi:putative endonuclease